MKTFKSVTKETLRKQLAEARTEFNLSKEGVVFDGSVLFVNGDTYYNEGWVNFAVQKLKESFCTCGKTHSNVCINCRTIENIFGDKLNGSDEKQTQEVEKK